MEREQLLNKLLAKEMERMRKICFKYERRNFLLNKVEIIENKEIDERGAIGTWNIKDIKNQYRYTHLIQINPCLIDNYIWTDAYKKRYKKELVDTIRHELIHAMVYEEFEGWVDRDEVKGTQADGSPVFLSCLQFLNGDANGHKCGNKFRYSKVYEQIKDFTEWKQLRKYCIKLMLSYNIETQKIKDKYNKQDYLKNNIKLINNSFRFSNVGFGLDADTCTKAKMKYRKNNSRLITLDSVFEIGAYILPQDLEKLFIKKINNYNFKEVIDERFVVTLGGVMINLRTKQKTNIKQAV